MGSSKFVPVVLLFCFATASAATPLALPWPNGDFELGNASWTLASTTSVGDVDGDGDQEASWSGCGDGTWQMSRGVTKGVVPATTSLSFDVESGQIDAMDVRMILFDAQNADPYVNNLYAYDVTGTLAPDWFDDQVLYWNSWTPVTGTVTLDPLAAHAVNIPGWDAMSAAEREAKLSTMTHMTMVMYGCTAGGAGLDDFAWVVG